jgi:hypothetical protein
MRKRARTSWSLRCSSGVKARAETGDFAPFGHAEACPSLEAAFRGLQPALRGDLRPIRVAALAFKLAVRGAHPIAVAHAVDDDGAEHWLAARAVGPGGGAGATESAYLEILADLVRRGLAVTKPLIVDADGCAGLAARLELAFGPVVHAGSTRDLGGLGLAW